MSLLQILEFPDPRLRTKAKPVAVVDDSIRKLVADMFETMYDAPGIGLAATQVNVHQRIIVVDGHRFCFSAKAWVWKFEYLQQ